MELKFGPRRGIYIDISDEIKQSGKPLSAKDVSRYETFDTIYRSLCAILYNYAPLSGHPGGSISTGRFVSGILYNALKYDVSDPQREDADIISYAAGHKALGLYAMWALRNEIVRIGAPEMLPSDETLQLRLEDLLGFRRNPTTATPLFNKFNAKPLDGHPTPATPFVRLSTGASGVGMATSLGMAYGAIDYYGIDNAPYVHIVEGEGGLTPGRVSEAMAAAGTASLKNAVLHIDWNQASIDSDHVCRDGSQPGDYVQWDPAELAYLHDWNVIMVPDGTNFQQIFAAQEKALNLDNAQPTAIVYRTTKGWQYGIEGRKSHGAGHKLCSEGFYDAVRNILEMTGGSFPYCDTEKQLCNATDSIKIEECFWNALLIIRNALEKQHDMVDGLADGLKKSKDDLNTMKRKPSSKAPTVEMVYSIANNSVNTIPKELVLAPGAATTLRGELGRSLQYYNNKSQGSLFSASADLLGSTSINLVGQDFADGYFNADTNPGSCVLSIGGICEDAMSGIMAGISTYGRHIGVCSSYGAFIAALGHISARLHAIGNQARKETYNTPYNPFILICAHAGVKTGEDGPTHADPQPLQLLQENFPAGTMLTLTPWDPQEMWVLISAALAKRPAVIAPFVTRPTETIVDRKASGIAPVEDAATGVYCLKKSSSNTHGTLVLQGSEVAYAFVNDALPLLNKAGIDMNVYYIASAELFDLLPESEQKKIFPEERAQEAMGITGFTMPTLYRWIQSEFGRNMSLYPFKKGHFLGSGKAGMVLAEAGLDGNSQYEAIARYIKNRK